jgi:hypothetical protein
MLSFKFIEEAVADVSAEHDKTGIGIAEGSDFVRKGVAHGDGF